MEGESRLDKFAKLGGKTLVGLVTIAYAWSIYKARDKGVDIDVSPKMDQGRGTITTSDDPEEVLIMDAWSYTSPTTPEEEKAYKEKPEQFYSPIKPTEVARFKVDRERNIAHLTKIEGTVQNNDFGKVGNNHTYQINCPPSMKTVTASYDGRRVDMVMLPEESTGNIIAKAKFEVKSGTRPLKILVEYGNGEWDKYEIPFVGEH